MSSKIAAIVLAAGKGTRFKSTTVNKVALMLAGKPIVLYGIELLEKLNISPILVVVGFAADSVRNVLKGHDVLFVEQKEQLGTADALAVGIRNIPRDIEHVLVINGDDVFHTRKNLQELIKVHVAKNPALTFLTRNVDNPYGVGRIVRDAHTGSVAAIIEEKDATETERKIHEVNAAAYIFSVSFLKKYLKKLEKSSVTGEYYITDLVATAMQYSENIKTVDIGNTPFKIINNPDDLKEAEKIIIQT